MATIRPKDLPAASSVGAGDAFVSDTGSSVVKATPLQIVNAATPLASQVEAESGSDNTKRMTPLRVKQAIEVMGVLPSDLASTEAGKGGEQVATKQLGTGAVVEDVTTVMRRSVWAESFGLSQSNTPAENAAAIMAAVVAVRTNAASLSTDGLNGGTFTAYASGEILFGEGQFPVDTGVLQFAQDLGIIFRGRGSRKTNNAVKGRTALVFSGTGEFGIQLYGNGARGFVCQDMDLLYSGGFDGDILDNFGAPGMELQRVHIGTEGISGGTREATARSLIRATYFEFIELLQVTFNGAVDGLWFDDARVPVDNDPVIEFGGSAVTLDRCVFYDLTGDMVRHDGARNLKRLTIRESSFNPISMNCTRALDLTNVDALTVQGCMFTPSTTYIATGDWLNIENCTGSVRDCEFLGDCDVGTLRGDLTWANNVWVSTNGPEFTGGSIRAWGCEATGTGYGYKLTGTTALSAVIGPDRFGAGLDYSYDIPVDSTNLEVLIQYAPSWDAVPSGFRNVSGRVSIRNVARRAVEVSAAAYTVLRSNTGCIIRATGTENQTFTLPAIADSAGLEFTFLRNNAFDLTIVAPPGTLLVGGGAAKTSMTFPAGDVGSMVTLTNVAGTYNTTQRLGGVTFT